MANKQKEVEKSTNDWNQSDEDDNWDDWGDDDDKFVHVESEQTSENKNDTIKSESTHETTPTATTTKAAPQSEEVQNPNCATSSSSWGGLWSGKLSSVLSTATEGLGTLGNQVNQGLNQIIGVPQPEELAKIIAEEQKQKTEHGTNEEPTRKLSTEQLNENEESSQAFGLDFVTNLGSKVLNTGLDTLEGIGKKTMTILQDNDPKLMNKRKLLGLEPNKPNLSAILLEAKKDADQFEESLAQLQLEKKKAQLRFEVLFENYCGLVHFEALEILSKESKLKLDTLLEAVSGNALADLKETIEEVKELLELEDLECESEGHYEASELGERLLSSIADVDLGIQFDELASHWLNCLNWLNSTEATSTDDLEEIYAKSIHALSEACSLEMLKLHKIAELLLVKQHHSTASEVDAIVNLCKQFNVHLQGLAHRYAAILTSKGQITAENGENNSTLSEESKSKVNTFFAEMLSAVQYIEQAYKLFTPILQMGAV